MFAPPATGVLAPELPPQQYGGGIGRASLLDRSGNGHIPQGSNNFPGDQSGMVASEVGGGPKACSSGTKTSAARSPLDSQVDNGCPRISCSSKAVGENSLAASSERRDGLSHISWESQPARSNAWATPHNVAASSMHGDPRNTSCAVDCASRVGSPEDKSGRTLPWELLRPFI